MSGLERQTLPSSVVSQLTVILILTVVALPPSSNGHATEDDFLRLRDNLTSNYNRHMRPVRNQSAPVYINFDLTLVSILEIKDTECQVDLIPQIEVNWHDPNLVWNPYDYGGISQLCLTESFIWAPHLALYPSQQGSAPGPLWDIPTSHAVHSNGHVSFFVAGHISIFCDLDMTYFPYDYQTCDLGIKIVDAISSEVDFGSYVANLNDDFIQNREWIVKNISSKVQHHGRSDPAAIIYMSLTLQRLPAFNSLNIIVPAIVNSILCMLTFCVPTESGERLSYTLTTLLSLAVYITYIGGLIPRSSNPIPILFEYMIFLFTISAVCVILTLLVIKLRWTRVETSPFDNHKYICLLGFRISLTRKRKLNQIDVICAWCKGNAENGCNKNDVSMHDSNGNWGNKKEKMTDFMKTEHTSKENAVKNCKPIHSENEKKLQIEQQNSVKFPFQLTDEGSPPSADEDADKGDPALLSLCHKLDVVSLFLTFSTFAIMTTYTFARFFQQEEPMP